MIPKKPKPRIRDQGLKNERRNAANSRDGDPLPKFYA